MKPLSPQPRDLGGGFRVRRLLPSAAQAAVGPFVFFDHFGPVTAGPADDHDVRPHPHIGLATVTYLFEGAMMHRDSVGAVQRIEPGAVNLMVAGRGVVHSERTPDDLRGVERTSHGLQLWLGLPEADEAMPPAFTHTPSDELPELRLPGATVRVLIGSLFGATSPVPTRSPTLYADLSLDPGASLVLPAGDGERALYPVDRGCGVDGERLDACTLGVIDGSGPVRLDAPDGARVMLVGGAPLGHRYLWWNFVSSRKALIEQAADDWAAKRFPAVPGESGFIPLPARRP